MKNKWMRAGQWIGLSVLWMAIAVVASAQAVSTTTVQGTVYLANGQPGAGTVNVSWPAFTTASNQAVAAGSINVTIAPDGFLSVNLAPNLGATPAGLYYTVIYQMSDGSTSTEYWVVPAAAQASIGQVRAQVMPAAQAVQAVSKAYVDQAIAEQLSSELTSSGGTLTGPLYLCCNPTSPMEAADKSYVDSSFAQAVPLTGANMTGPLGVPDVNGIEAPVAGSAQTTLQATISAAGTNGAVQIPPNYSGADSFTNANGIYVSDLRQTSSQQYERSVKEFGAFCDGVTDDTNALQSAINYAQTHGVALTIPQGTCLTHTLNWHGESIGGLGKQVSALKGFPGQDVLATTADSTSILRYTRIHDLTIYVDQSIDSSCSPAEGRAAAGQCTINRPVEVNSIFSPGGSGLNGVTGTGPGWSIGNCAIAMPAITGAGGNGLQEALVENLEIIATGADLLSQYTGIHSTHTCGLYLAQWPRWSEFRNISINGLNTGIVVSSPTGSTIPAGLNADSNRWENITMQVTHGFESVAGDNNVLDNIVVLAGNSAASGEPPTGLVLDFANIQKGWTIRNSTVLPTWDAVLPKLTVSASGGSVIGVTVGPEHGLGFDPYGLQIPVTFSGSCTAQASANVNTDGSIGSVTIQSGGVGCSTTTAASLNVTGTWDTAADVNLIAGQNMTATGGKLQGGVGGYTVWNASGSQSYGATINGGGTLPGGGTYPTLLINNGLGISNGYTGSANTLEQSDINGGLVDNGLGNVIVQINASGKGEMGLEPARLAPNTVSADYALLGAGSANQAFTSLNDLFLSAEDLLWTAGETAGTGSQFAKDPTSPITGSYVKAIGGAWDTQGTWHIRGIADYFVLGKTFPVGVGTWYIAAKADTATSQEYKLTGTGDGGVICVFADKVENLTSSWQIFPIQYNTVTGNSACDSYTQGNPVLAYGLTPSSATNIETAWISFVPAYQSLLIAQNPTQSNQAATKGYVDQAVSNQIANGAGALPIAGGTLTGALNAPQINGTTNCALSANVSSCIQSSTSALIPPGTTGSYSQGGAIQASANCIYDLTQGGKITQIIPEVLGSGYTTVPTISINNGNTGGTGLAVVATISNGSVTGYSISNGGSGYTACPQISVAPPTAAAAPIPVLDQRKGINTYTSTVRVDDFGCAADGVTDDTQCINNAIEFATSNGTKPGAITFTQGKTYFVSQITGYMQTAADDGSAPASGDTCAKSNAAQTPPISGSNCVSLKPETPGQLGYAIQVPDNLSIYGNGATMLSNFNETTTTFSLQPPYIAMFGSSQQITNLTVFDLTISHAFIGWTSPGFAGDWNFNNVSTNSTGISILANILQLSELRNIFFNSMAGIVVGGWWQCRAASQCPQGFGDFADNVLIDGYQYYGIAPTTPFNGVVANQNGLDNWFNTNFFHMNDNATRMTDNQYATLGADTDSFWRGIFGVGIAYYSRTQRPSNANEIKNYVNKVSMSYPIIITTPTDLLIDSMASENSGDCEQGVTWGTPGICPNPYDPVNTQLEAEILFQTPSNTVIRNVEAAGIDAEEVVGESWRYSASSTLRSLRTSVTSTNSSVASRQAVTNPQPESERQIFGYSNLNPISGSEDSGEECFVGLGVYATGSSDNDEWCLRNALSTYSGSAAMQRYFVLENEYSGFHFTGAPAVQMPGLRVRTGSISVSDPTLPITDLSSQSFTISGGTVSGNSCSTIAGISLPGAATSDGILFVQAPTSAAPLQITGNITSAGTLSLSLCNTTTITALYPSGTYTAFLLDAASPVANPANTGGAPTSTNPLTSTVGDLVVANSSGTPGRLPGSTAAQTAVLTQTGNGTVSAVPVWQTAPTLNGSNITNISGSNLTAGTVGVANGGTGAATASQALANLGGANLNAPSTVFAGSVTGNQIGAAYQVDQFAGADFGARLSACVAGLSSTFGGTCDARNFSDALSMAGNVTISTSNATIWLPCATITTSSQIIVTAGTRNVSLHGCSLRGTTNANGSQGGTAFVYTGNRSMFQIGDPTYSADTSGFHVDNVVINTVSAANSSAQGIVAYRTQEMYLESLYLLGNQNQTGMTLDGTGNYTGGTYYDIEISGYQSAVNAIGHQITNPATTDWMNASTFVRLHIDCPTSGGNPIAGTYGINLLQGDGNTFTGGDVEGCNVALHLGANAQNNTFLGVRNENSNNQVIADTGSQFNSWITGGTMFTGKLSDNGSRNSFLDSFHRTFNGINGDWYASQQDATVTNHFRLGIGSGNVRGIYWETQVDSGTSSSIYNWQWGLTDGTSGQSNWVFNDLINNTTRIQIQENNTAGSNGTAINGTGTGNVCFQCSANSGMGGVAFSSGGATPTTVATIDSSGDGYFNGTLQSAGQATIQNTVEVKNNANQENDFVLWSGSTSAQKESLIYKNYQGASQWYLVNNTTNDWAVNSAISGIDSFKAYQSTNSSDTYVDASSSSGVVRVNYESGSGTGFKIYGGSSSSLYAAFTGTTAIQFPGLAASSGYNCLQVDASGFLTNTGSPCGSGSGSGVLLAPTASQAVAQPIGTTLGVTSLNDVFYVDGYPSSGCVVGSTAYTTQLDCAMATISTWLQTSNESAVLVFGEKGSGAYYDTCTGVTIPQYQNRSISLIGYGAGGINQSSTIRQICPINQAMVFKADTPGTNANATIKISGLNLWGYGNASSCINLSGLQGSVIEDTFCNGGFTDSGGEDAIATFGADYTSEGWVYETSFRNFVISGDPVGLPATMASVTAPISSGTIASNSYTVTNSGAGYVTTPNPPIVYLWGNGAGAQPCTTMPTGLSATVSGGAITAVTAATAGTGCTGPVNVEIFNSTAFTYGVHLKHVTDSDTENVVVRGPFKGASIYEEEFPINNVHAHAYSGQYISFEDNGGVVWDSAQVDTVGHIGFSVNGPGTTIKSPLFSANGNYPNGVGVLLNSSATDISILGSFSCYPNNVNSGWIKVETASGGPFISGVAPPTDTNLFGSGTCDATTSPTSNLAAAAIQEMPTSTATSSSNYPSNNLAFTDSWWNGTSVQGVPWTINSSHTGGANGTESLNIFTPSVSGFTGVNSLSLASSAAATASLNVSAPGISHTGSYWNGTGSVADTWSMVPVLGSGTAPTSALTIAHAGSSGTASVSIPYQTSVASLSSSGTLSVTGLSTLSGGVSLPSVASASGHNCLQVDTAGNITNTGSACGAGSGGSGTVTSVGLSLPSDWSVSGSPVTGSGTLTASYVSHAANMFFAGPSSGSAAAPSWRALTASDLPASITSNTSGTAAGLSATLAVSSGGTGSATTPTAGQIEVGNAGGTAYAPVSVSGDGTLSSAGALTVTKTNGTVFGTAATVNTGTSGAAIPLLNAANTWSANTTIFANGAASEQDVIIQPGSTADQIGALEWNSYSGTDEWKLRKDASNYIRFTDMVNSLDRLILYQNGQTGINSGAGANAVVINNTSGSGTGGLIVYEGGSNYNTAAFTVSGTGNATVPGTLTTSGTLALNWTLTSSSTISSQSNIYTFGPTMTTNTNSLTNGIVRITPTYNQTGTGESNTDLFINRTETAIPSPGAQYLIQAQTGSANKFTVSDTGALSSYTHAGLGTMTLATGAAAGTSPTIACATSHVCDGVSGTVTLTTGTSPTTGTLGTLTFPTTHTNQANCLVEVLQSTGMVTSTTWAESTTALTLTANTALTASTAYTVKYWCGGN